MWGYVLAGLSLTLFTDECFYADREAATAYLYAYPFSTSKF